jgi:hypothetical protein
MRKVILYLALLLAFVPVFTSHALTGTENIEAAIRKASTDELLLLRELIDAELEQRYALFKAIVPKENTYVLNTNSKKFHIPSCESITRMDEKNKKDYQGNRDELLEFGFKPCGACNP